MVYGVWCIAMCSRMLAKFNPGGRSHMDQMGHPIIRTYYDHIEVGG